MRKTRLRFSALILAILLLGGCASGERHFSFFRWDSSSSDQSSESSGGELTPDSPTSPDLWKVTSDTYGGSFYLFGSIHIGRADTYPLPEYVTDAYNSCDALAVEMDIISFESAPESEILRYYQPYVYTDGTNITDHISAELYEKCRNILTDAGYYNIYLDYYKPAFWCSMIDTVALEKTDCSTDYGIDRHFLTLARQDSKEILEIESAELQMGLELRLSDELTTLLLEEYCADGYFDDYSISTDEMLSAWSQGRLGEWLADAAAEDALANPDADYRRRSEEYDRIFITERNTAMADAAESYMSAGRDVFFIVGAAHMYGDGGIVALLTERGFTVTPVK